MSKPVELIVTNELHRVAGELERWPKALVDKAIGADAKNFGETMARQMLCDLAHQSRIEVVLNALAAAGLADGADGLMKRLAAVREQRAEEARAHGADPDQPQATAAQPDPEKVFGAIVDKLKDALGPGVTVTPVKVDVKA